MAASKRFTLKRPAAALGPYMHDTDLSADVRIVDDEWVFDEDEVTSSDPTDPAEKTFGVASVSLNAQHRFINKHWMHMGHQLNSRMPLHQSDFSPERRWRFLTRYLMDFVTFVSRDLALFELTQARVKAYQGRDAILGDIGS